MASPEEARILAQGLYQIRLILGGYLGADVEADPVVRVAAHLAYALHNEALATLADKSFDVDAAIGKVSEVDEMFGSSLALHFLHKPPGE